MRFVGNVTKKGRVSVHDHLPSRESPGRQVLTSASYYRPLRSRKYTLCTFVSGVHGFLMRLGNPVSSDFLLLAAARLQKRGDGDQN